MVDIQKLESEIRRLNDEIDRLKDELKAERLRNLENPVSTVGRIIKDLYGTFYRGKSYELLQLLQRIKQAKYNLSPEDGRAIEVLLHLENYPLGQWIWSLDIRWEWLNEHQKPDNEFLVQLAEDTRKAIDSYYLYLLESKKIFDKYDEFKKENSADLKKMYDIYDRIAGDMEAFLKSYGTHYGIEYMEIKRIGFE